MRLEDEIKQEKFIDNVHKAILNIQVTYSWILNSINRILKPFGISNQQFNVLQILKAHYPKPIMLSTIQERMMDRNSNVTRIIDRLCEKGYVTCHRNTQDRRKVDIALTKSGLDLRNEILPLLVAAKKQMDNISEEEALELNRVLDKLRQ